VAKVESVLIGSFLRRIKRPVDLLADKKYKLVTVKLKHKGVVLREEKFGSQIKSKMYEVKEGDFILSGIDARNGAFGIVPKELDGAIVTNDFWYFDIDDKIVDKHFFLELTSTQWFDEICRKGSDGTTQRIRLQKNKFFNQEINLPAIEKQGKFISWFTQCKQNSNELTAELTHQQNLLKKLRQAILQEAIEGKLTAEWRLRQNPTVEPAAELLARIRAEKAQLLKTKKIRKQKPLPPIAANEIPFDLPAGWVWCRLGEICSKTGSGSTPRGGKSAYVDEGIKFIRSQNVYNSGLILENIAYIPVTTHEKMKETKINPEDLLLNITGGSIGRCAIVPNIFDTANINQHVAIIRTIKNGMGYFLHNIVLSDYFQQEIIESQTGAGREGLPKNKMDQIAIPLPPLAEQKAIVAKVESLLAVVDQLQAQNIAAQQRAGQLMQSVLKEAFQANDGQPHGQNGA